MMRTCLQTLLAITQQLPPAATTSSPTVEATAVEDTLHSVNDDVSIIKASRFQSATAPLSPKVGILHQIHPSGGPVIDFPSEEPISSDSEEEEI
uniref:Secreted protein n=1 Tax=Romanomermis culicivorax TaxID=13658 RepID=A0A915L777_ROMCU